MTSRRSARKMELLLELWQAYGITVLFVTHDVDEAIFLSDRILVLSERPGRVWGGAPGRAAPPAHGAVLTSPDFMQLEERALALLFDTQPGASAQARG